MVSHSFPHSDGAGGDSQCEVLLGVAAVSQKPRPQLHSYDAEDEEDEKAEEKDVTQHGQRVEQQVHQDTHAWRKTDKYICDDTSRTALWLTLLYDLNGAMAFPYTCYEAL